MVIRDGYVPLDEKKVEILDRWLQFLSLRHLGKMSGVGVNIIQQAMVRYDREGIANIKEDDWNKIETVIREHGVIE